MRISKAFNDPPQSSRKSQPEPKGRCSLYSVAEERCSTQRPYAQDSAWMKDQFSPGHSDNGFVTAQRDKKRRFTAEYAETAEKKQR
jgi:hypothetical protein